MLFAYGDYVIIEKQIPLVYNTAIKTNPEVLMKNKALKKILSVMLAAVLVTGSSSLIFKAFADEGKVVFTVGTDIHIDTPQEKLEVNYPESELYFQASGSGNIYDQAEALTKDFLSKSVSDGADFILISGDLTRAGNEQQHRQVSSLLTAFEKKSGVQIYVVPGNHDYYNSTREEFKEYYAGLCYDDALTVHSATASYTADLCGNYRLIAVDSNNPGEDGDGITKELISWIDAQVSKAHEDGREIIFMMHHPLLEHLYLGHIIMKDFMVRNSKQLAEKFCSWGIKYVFTGHEHGNDVASYTGKNGGTVYDVLTTALSAYPLEYRKVTMTPEGADLVMRKMEKCNMGALIGGYTDRQKALLRSDYEKFAYGLFRYSVEKKILKFTDPDFIKGKLKVSGPLAIPVDNLFNAVNDALTMPLYDDGGKVSIEKLAASKGVSIPESDYGSLLELASAMVAMHYYGNENMPAGTNPECEILIKGLNTGLEYVLTKSGRSGLNLLLSVLGTEIDTEVLSPLFRAVIAGKENSYVTAEKVLYPLLDKFAVDFSLPDRDVYLAA